MKSPRVSIDINTDSFLLKLRAIAKHSTALADDLEKIDSVTCDDCGGLMDVTELKADNKVIDTSFECPRCDEEHEDND